MDIEVVDVSEMVDQPPDIAVMEISPDAGSVVVQIEEQSEEVEQIQLIQGVLQPAESNQAVTQPAEPNQVVLQTGEPDPGVPQQEEQDPGVLQLGEPSPGGIVSQKPNRQIPGRPNEINKDAQILEVTGGYQCSVCPVLSRRFADAKLHNRTHTGEKMHQCDVCQKQFARRDNLTLHMRGHTGQKPFKCDVCNRTFIGKANLVKHAQTHVAKPDKPFKCDICNAFFLRKDHLSNHMNIHAAVKPFKCGLCQREFNQQATYQCHMNIHRHDKRFPCPQCPQKFYRKHYLSNHLKYHSSGAHFFCGTCGKMYGNKEDAELHVWECPGIIHCCKHCDVTFDTLENYQAHVDELVEKCRGDNNDAVVMPDEDTEDVILDQDVYEVFEEFVEPTHVADYGVSAGVSQQPVANEVVLQESIGNEVVLLQTTKDEVVMQQTTEDEVVMQQTTEDEVVMQQTTEDEVVMQQTTEDELVMQQTTENEVHVVLQQPILQQTTENEVHVVLQQPILQQTTENEVHVVLQQTAESEVVLQQPIKTEVVMQEPAVSEVVLQQTTGHGVVMQQTTEKEPEVVLYPVPIAPPRGNRMVKKGHTSYKVKPAPVLIKQVDAVANKDTGGTFVYLIQIGDNSHIATSQVADLEVPVVTQAAGVSYDGTGTMNAPVMQVYNPDSVSGNPVPTTGSYVTTDYSVEPFVAKIIQGAFSSETGPVIVKEEIIPDPSEVVTFGTKDSIRFNTVPSEAAQVDLNRPSGWRNCEDKTAYLIQMEDGYQCSVCPKKIRRINDAKLHIRTHTREMLYVCSVCSRKYTRAEYLTNHMKTHTGQKPYACHVCEQKFIWKSNLRRHLILHSGEKPFPCDQCPAKFARKAQLNRHVKCLHEKEPRECVLCMDVLYNQSTFGLHMARHRLDKQFSCTKCPQKYYRRSSLVKHAKKHAKCNKSIFCPKCGVESRSAQLAQRHLDICGGLCYICQHCQVSFVDLEAYQVHVDQLIADCEKSAKRLVVMSLDKRSRDAAVNLDDDDDQDEDDDDFDSGSAVVAMSDTDNRPDVIAKTINHGSGRKNREDPNAVYTKVDEGYKCSTCEIVIQRIHDIKIHIRTHTRETPYSCSMCAKRFTRRQYLADHMKTHWAASKNDPRPHACDICERRFMHKNHLTQHLMSHERDKNMVSDENGKIRFVCDACSSTFASKRGLRKHVKEFHMKLRPKECVLCKKRFFDGDKLRSHMAYHRQDKRASCTQCVKTFYLQRNLKSHLKQHTQGLVFCPKCGSRCGSDDEMEEHVKDCTGLMFMCNHCRQAFDSLASYQAHVDLLIAEGEKKDLGVIMRLDNDDSNTSSDDGDDTQTAGATRVQIDAENMNAENLGDSMEESQMDIDTVHPSLDASNVDEQIGPSSAAVGGPGITAPRIKIVKVEIAEEPDVGSSLGHKCKKCDKVFMLASYLKRHMGSCKKRHNCEKCEKRFMSEKHLEIHFKNCTRNWCDRCKIGFKSAQSLEAHMFLHKTSVQCVRCRHCDNVFASKVALHNHERTHKDILHFCTVCSKSFKSKSLKDEHEKDKHADDVTFLCSYCDYQFLTKEKLFEHCAENHKAASLSDGDEPMKFLLSKQNNRMVLKLASPPKITGEDGASQDLLTEVKCEVVDDGRRLTIEFPPL